MFKILIAVLSTFLFFLLFELILLLSNFSYVPFQKNEQENSYSWMQILEQTEKQIEKNSPLYINQPSLARSQFINPKKNEVFRIVLIGGSSIYNLDKAISLRDQLSSDNKKVEIINLGLLAQGSAVLSKVSEKLQALKPDLVIIYSGHNEFLSLLIEDSQSKKNFWSSLSSTLIKNLKSFQLALYLSHLFQEKFYSATNHSPLIETINTPQSKFVSVDDGYFFDHSLKEQTYLNYKQNISKIIENALSAGAKVLISSVAYNRMSHPWAPAGIKSKHLSDFQNCKDLYQKNYFAEAKICYEEVIENDSLPVRTTNTQNKILASLADNHEVYFIDFDKIIVQKSLHNIPGFDLFTDYCHLNQLGNELLLEEWANFILSKGIYSK